MTRAIVPSALPGDTHDSHDTGTINTQNCTVWTCLVVGGRLAGHIRSRPVGGHELVRGGDGEALRILVVLLHAGEARAAAAGHAVLPGSGAHHVVGGARRLARSCGN